jgi:hypothetical protein
MSSKTLARRLDRLEAKLSPTDKPGITVIVDGAGALVIFHLPDRGITQQNVTERKGLDDWLAS